MARVYASLVAYIVAMQLMKQYDATFTLTNETIVRRQQGHTEELGLGISDLSQTEIIEIKV